MAYTRNEGRTALQMRPVSIETDPFGYAEASVILSFGNTKVLASISIDDGVPRFMRNSNNAWLTAEYAMLPAATRTRNMRESGSHKRKGRSVEISRLIGRCLRSVVDLKGAGECTITVDCDVLQADGGTRTACITAASYALRLAFKRWNLQGRLKRQMTCERIAALSGGIVQDTLLVDLDHDEDCTAQADVNFVMTESGNLIEIQGTAEQSPLAWDQFVELKDAVAAEMQQLFALETE